MPMLRPRRLRNAERYTSTVISHPEKDKDIWRTWYIEECERESLFGLNQPFLGFLYTYRVGTEFYLEDARYFWWKDRTIHRICGPYIVKATALPHKNCTYSHRRIVYHDYSATKGPWLDHEKIWSTINGERIQYSQYASWSNYFPYRFGMQRSPCWSDKYPPHTSRCPWCLYD